MVNMNKIRILVDEEFGYRTWIWEPNFSKTKDFLTWFSSIDASTRMDTFYNPTILPGIWREVSDEEEIDLKGITGHAYLHTDEDSFVQIGDDTARWSVSNRIATNY